MPASPIRKLVPFAEEARRKAEAEAKQKAAEEAGLGKVCNNPFKSIVVRSVEVLFACIEALRIIESYRKPEQPCVEVLPRGEPPEEPDAG